MTGSCAPAWPPWPARRTAARWPPPLGYTSAIDDLARQARLALTTARYQPTIPTWKPRT